MVHVLTKHRENGQLNEDQYSELTLTELYNKLGENKFFEYIEFTLTRIVNSLKSETKFNTSEGTVDKTAFFTSITYKRVTADMPECLIMKKQNEELTVEYTINYQVIWRYYWSGREKNILKQLNDVITYYYELPESRRLRNMMVLMTEPDVVRSFRIFQLTQNKFIVQTLSPSNEWIKWIGPHTTPHDCVRRMVLNGASKKMKFVVFYRNKKPTTVSLQS